ncbi:MAG: PDDEXK nuclease domain-containing protein [Bacillota bacterium]|nr:PDDEXK nuclease domain-containing protein [Bacillota bacterium]
MENKELSIRHNQEYKEFLFDLKEKVKSSQLKAAVKVNYELLNLYWNLGKEIVAKQEQYAWGDSFLSLLSTDLKKEFPNMKGFSKENLKHIRYWYLFYSENLIGLQAVTQLEDVERKIKHIPWGHNQRIMYKCETVKQALFYVEQTLENGWSRTVLEHQIDSKLYERKGSAVTNFDSKLPEPQSDLAKQTIKDPYSFDFLTLRDQYDEKELEDALVKHITSFLLELGSGFSYIGRQVHLQVGESDFYIDLLFYHVKLHCYVVIELKTEKLKPEFIGQLNFYVTAVNREMKSEEDQPTIGILICKDKDDVVAEYSLEGISQPIGISKYELNKLLDKEYKSSLPSIEELEQEIRSINNEK